MAYLVDSNLLLRWAQSQTPEHQSAVDAVAKLHAQRENVVVVAQCLVEFWAVETRPLSANGFGLPLGSVYQDLQGIKGVFPMLPENALIYPTGESLVYSVGVSGKQVHDARLAAATHIHGDFTRFQRVGPGITVILPGRV